MHDSIHLSDLMCKCRRVCTNIQLGVISLLSGKYKVVSTHLIGQDL